MERLRDYILILIVLLFVGFWYYGLTASAVSLFDVEDENSPWYPEEDEPEIEFTLPDYATDENGNVLINADTTLEEVLNPEPESEDDFSVSGNDLELIEPSVPYSEVESLVDTLVEESLAETRAANLSIADAYLSSAIVDVFSRVVDGSPAHYKYVAYRLNANDANEGYLLIDSRAKVNGNCLEFSPGAQLCHYYRYSYTSGYQTYWNYKYDVSEITDTYRIPYTNGQLIYTNMVSGFPVLSENNEKHLGSILIPVCICAVIFFVMRRKK
ncbi:MAG: hypothetical protein NC123_04375 [Butyrivibrio sp.]|nr:hypothetical protein [Acetatifactor muris]MCM1558764.1 hypothetical protein [Butyrivibrio sp.]